MKLEESIKSEERLSISGRLQPEPQGYRQRKGLKKGFIYLILTLYSIINAYPLIWMVLNSFKTTIEFSQNPFSLPAGLHWENYVEAWRVAKLGTYFFNSIRISILATAITVFLGALASYFISRFEFEGKKWVYSFFIFGMLIPVHAILVPMFILMQKLGLLNTIWALFFPYIAFNLPMTIFILVGFMNAFPKEIEESAVMDGCGVFRIFWSIILPMSRPALATVTILTFINNWNEFSFALVLINSVELKTIPLGLANFAGQYSTNYVVQMAGLTMALLPVLIIYLILEKYLVKGMTAGAVKG